MKDRIAAVLVILGFALLLLELSPLVSALYLGYGLVLVWLTSEIGVRGFKGLAKILGFSDYVAGVVSSVASNLPEAFLAGFMALSPHLREVAAIMVMLAAAFNAILLGLLIILITWKRPVFAVPSEALTVESEAMRMGTTISFLFTFVGIVAAIIGNNEVVLPREAAVIPLLIYLAYAAFLRQRKEDSKGSEELDKKEVVLQVCLSIAGIVLGAELISSAAEFWTAEANLHPVLAATVLAFAGSIPEHAIAVLGSSRGYLELGFSNLIAGIVQSILLVFPLVALLAPVPLDGYVIFQLAASALTLWIVERAITDDKRVTKDEGIFLILTQVLGILLLDELSLMI